MKTCSKTLKTPGSLHVRKLACLLLCLLLTVGVFAAPCLARAQETEQKVVRVGWFESTFCYKDPFGRRCGIDYEYQHRISAYTGWTFEYVEDSWSNLLQKLIAGEIDLLSDVSWTEERTELMLFPELPMGSESYYVYIDADNREITAGDPASFNGKRIGVNKGSVQEGYLREWAEKNGITPEVVPLTVEEAESMTMLAGGKIDGYASTNTFGAKEKVIPVSKIGSSDFYYAVNRNRPDLLKELNMALSSIQDEDPGFNDRMYEEHISSTQTNAFLTPDQEDWLSANGPIRVGYRENSLPFCQTDRETGELTGALRDYLAHAANSLKDTDIRFETVAYPSTKAAMEAMDAGEIDCVFPANLSSYDADELKVRLTNPAMKTEMQAVIRESDPQDISRDSAITFAAEAGDPNIETFIKAHYPASRIIYFPGGEASFEAVASGHADCVLVSNYRIRNAEEMLKKYGLFSVPTGESMPLSFAVGKANRELYFILNKTVTLTKSEDMDATLASYIQIDQKTSIAQFLRDHWIAALITLTAVFCVIILLLCRSLKAQRRTKALEDETKITELKQSITSLLDNIPGVFFSKDAKTGIYLACNQAFANYVHRKNPNAVIGLTDAELFDPETARRFAQDDRKVLLMDESFVFFEEMPDPEGKLRRFQTTKMKFTDSEGRLCVLGLSQDVTDIAYAGQE